MGEPHPSECLCDAHYAEWVADFVLPRQRAEDAKARVDNALSRARSAVEAGWGFFRAPVVTVPFRHGTPTLRLPCLRVATDVMMENEPWRLSAWFTNRLRTRKQK